MTATVGYTRSSLDDIMDAMTKAKEQQRRRSSRRESGSSRQENSNNNNNQRSQSRSRSSRGDAMPATPVNNRSASRSRRRQPSSPMSRRAGAMVSDEERSQQRMTPQQRSQSRGRGVSSSSSNGPRSPPQLPLSVDQVLRSSPAPPSMDRVPVGDLNKDLSILDFGNQRRSRPSKHSVSSHNLASVSASAAPPSRRSSSHSLASLSMSVAPPQATRRSSDQLRRQAPPPPPPKSTSPPMREEMGDATIGSGSRGVYKNHALNHSHSHHSLDSQATNSTCPSTEPCNSSERGRYRGQLTLPSIPSIRLSEDQRHRLPPVQSSSFEEELPMRGTRSSSRGRYHDGHRSVSRSRYSDGRSIEGGGSSASRGRSNGRSSSRGRSMSRMAATEGGRRSASRSRFDGRSSSRGRSQIRPIEHNHEINNRRSQSRSQRIPDLDAGDASSSQRRYRQVDHKDKKSEKQGGDASATVKSSSTRSMSRSRRMAVSRRSPPRNRSPSPEWMSSRSNPRRRRSRSRPRGVRSPQQEPRPDYYQQQQESSLPPTNTPQQDPPPSRAINLVIDAEGHGTFHIATKGLCNNMNEKSKSSKKSKDTLQQSHLTFDIQIDEASQRYLIHTSMGRLDKIRTIHPGMNILRTLSYWNELQKRRYGMNPTEVVKGGQLGIVSKNRTNLVMMTLMGDYSHRAWEYDEIFQRELERFVEDALQFHLCLNGDGGGGKGKGEDHVATMGGSPTGSVASNGNGRLSSKSDNHSATTSSNSTPTSNKQQATEDTTTMASNGSKRRSRLLGKVLGR